MRLCPLPWAACTSASEVYFCSHSLHHTYPAAPAPSHLSVLVHLLLSHQKILVLHTCIPVCMGLNTQERIRCYSISIISSPTRKKYSRIVSFVVIILNLTLFNCPISPLLTPPPRHTEYFMILTGRNLPQHIFYFHDGWLPHLVDVLSSLFSSQGCF